jgi:hypothetical protein
MSRIDPFVGGNILLFANQLRWERSPAHQETLKRLLIREEDRLGAGAPGCELVDRILRDGVELIERQTRLVAEARAIGVDPRRAERTLATFLSIQNLFEKFRADNYEIQERLKA